MVEDAVGYSRSQRFSDLVKLEVIGDERTLFPEITAVSLKPQKF